MSDYKAYWLGPENLHEVNPDGTLSRGYRERGLTVEIYRTKVGESVDQCAKRHGLRCLKRSEIRAGAEGTALIEDPIAGTWEAVKDEPNE